MTSFVAPARRAFPVARVLLLLAILLGSAALVGGPVVAGVRPTAVLAAGAPTGSSVRGGLSSLLAAPLATVSGAASTEPSAAAVAVPYVASSSFPVLLSLPLGNSSGLSPLLAALGDPNSSEYHHFLTASEFTRRFAPSPAVYDDLVAYLRASGLGPVTPFPDRLSVEIRATPATLGAAFHAPLDRYASSAGSYWAFAAAPELPTPLAGLVQEIAGVGPSSAAPVLPLARISAALTSPGSGAAPATGI